MSANRIWIEQQFAEMSSQVNGDFQMNAVVLNTMKQRQ